MQITLGYEHHEEIAPVVVEQRVANPAQQVRQHPVIGEIVKRLIADGTLDFLDVTRMAGAKSEVKPMGKKYFGAKPKWLMPRAK